MKMTIIKYGSVQELPPGGFVTTEAGSVATLDNVEGFKTLEDGTVMVLRKGQPLIAHSWDLIRVQRRDDQ